MQEAKSAMNELLELCNNPPNDLTLEQRVDMLNGDQSR